MTICVIKHLFAYAKWRSVNVYLQIVDFYANYQNF